uniref:Secreted protein n=1 Tax=Echinostoma caproni TaxID=27848 RepID=A0A183B2Q8_9TREM
LACIIVVSTSHPDPLSELIRLSDEQTQQQRSGDASYPRWFASNIVKLYVLIHDAAQVGVSYFGWSPFSCTSRNAPIRPSVSIASPEDTLPSSRSGGVFAPK